MRVAVVGAGWSGLSCAIKAVRAGHQVTVFEASRSLGGRARRIDALDDKLPFDNGQHILIGAYRETLAMMRRVGVDPESALLRLPLTLRFADGAGIALPRWPEPLHLVGGIATARGWTIQDKWTLLRASLRWRNARFRCDPLVSVAELCCDLSERIMRELIEPLCVSALNTPVNQSSGQVFLRVLEDSLFGTPGGADLLLPRIDLGRLFPDAAWEWLACNGAKLERGKRVRSISAASGGGWDLEQARFDAVVLATAATDAAKLVSTAVEDPSFWGFGDLTAAQGWISSAEALRFESIATVYLAGARPLSAPMVALRSSQDAPAQFAFDRAQLGGEAGSLALVVSASSDDRSLLERKVLAQARTELGQPHLTPVQTIVERRATFACTAGLQRPQIHIAPRLLACGDYADGPYPATLEGAVRNGIAAATLL